MVVEMCGMKGRRAERDEEQAEPAVVPGPAEQGLVLEDEREEDRIVGVGEPVEGVREKAPVNAARGPDLLRLPPDTDEVVLDLRRQGGEEGVAGDQDEGGGIDR